MNSLPIDSQWKRPMGRLFSYALFGDKLNFIPVYSFATQNSDNIVVFISNTNLLAYSTENLTPLYDKIIQYGMIIDFKRSAENKFILYFDTGILSIITVNSNCFTIVNKELTDISHVIPFDVDNYILIKKDCSTQMLKSNGDIQNLWELSSPTPPTASILLNFVLVISTQSKLIFGDIFQKPNEQESQNYSQLIYIENKDFFAVSENFDNISLCSINGKEIVLQSAKFIKSAAKLKNISLINSKTLVCTENNSLISYNFGQLIPLATVSFSNSNFEFIRPLFHEIFLITTSTGNTLICRITDTEDINERIHTEDIGNLFGSRPICATPVDANSFIMVSENGTVAKFIGAPDWYTIPFLQEQKLF
ncbi:hypothetical protein TVAG_142310 [Trichomonas vaginalis G3]|uniref:Uncharacterized protein n=1 Tax=Trichomonas vaginalis (strain ATCC PRA-98 / G3) TaxID=412133 RepID=A2EHJ0_TRIV3|nr:hypothetical protein TVAGG3_0775290 [Trichomonas vaginalis G3]EAY07877.1 hypothetical protein TVAG_142310 [Trichomonas vaginalis G3]KAI5514123.1 hypothetical protein TVAGG3_0775290 [Trichomonas vaginalis G3]|eukprot:XP_001320100.1 hypothetical protein [Trichomonas vaginalis G3]